MMTALWTVFVPALRPAMQQETHRSQFAMYHPLTPPADQDKDFLTLVESTSPQKPIPNVSENFKRHLAMASKITNDNVQFDTLRKYCYNFKKYILYVHVEVKGKTPVSMSDLIPAHPSVVKAFLANLLTENESYHAVRAARTALTYFHQRAGHSETMQHDFIRAFMQGASKRFQTPPVPARCPTDEEVHLWMTADVETFSMIRTQAILALMLGSGIRHDTTLALSPSDLQNFIKQITSLTQEQDDTATPFTADKIKTDTFRNSHLKQLVGKNFTRPVTKYLQTIGLVCYADLGNYTAVAPVFRQAQHTKTGTRLCPIKVTDTKITNIKPISKSTTQKDFKAFQSKYSPGLKATTLHAARSKFASALDKAGAGQLFIQRLGQWKSNCFLRYLDSPAEADAEQLLNLHDSLFE